MEFFGKLVASGACIILKPVYKLPLYINICENPLSLTSNLVFITSLKGATM